MDHAGSYAAGRPLLGHHDTRAAAHRMHARQVVLPAPRPTRMPWSTRIFAAGIATCALVLVAVLAGIPGRLAYDVDAPGARVKPDTMEPLAVQRALDSNMKLIDAASSDAPGSYVGYIKSINEHELAIAATAEALLAMESAVAAISSGMGDVNATTAQMRASMEHMAQVSSQSAATMGQLDGDIGFLARSMQQLAGSTAELVERMAAVEGKAGSIATNGTAKALDATRDLNRSLPSDVPAPVYRNEGLQ